eukprot:403361947
MKFGEQFDYHKIPEWYADYFDYLRFKAMSQNFADRVKFKEAEAVQGYYSITTTKKVIRIDINKSQNTFMPSYLNPVPTLTQDQALQNSNSIVLANKFTKQEQSALYQNDNSNQTLKPIKEEDNESQLEEEDRLEREILKEELSGRYDNIRQKTLKKITIAKDFGQSRDRTNTHNHLNQLKRLQTQREALPYMIRDGAHSQLPQKHKPIFDDSILTEDSLDSLENSEKSQKKRFSQTQIMGNDRGTKRKNSKLLVLSNGANEVEKVLKFDLPKIDKKIINALEKDFSVNRKQQSEGEEKMKEWVTQFIEEVDRIEKFYQDKFNEYRQEFKKLKFQYNTKNVMGSGKGPNLSQEKNNGNDPTISDYDYFKRPSTYSQDAEELREQLISKEDPNQSNQQLENTDKRRNSEQRKPINVEDYKQMRLNTLLKIANGANVPKELSSADITQFVSNTATIEKQKLNKAKDELEYATNWQRAFTNVYTHFKWLNSFTQINFIALQKQLQKFVKTFFQFPDNIIDKKLLAYLENKSFVNQKDVNKQLKKIIRLYQTCFTDGSKKKAMYSLEKKEVEMRRKDLILISMFTGAITVTGIMTILVLVIPGADDPWEDWLELFNSFYTFRFIFMCILILAFTGIDIYILRAFKVNYLFIFELDPQYKITHIQLLRPAAIFTLVALIIFLGMCFMPIHILYQRARKSLLKVLFHIFISPFGVVRFRHFFFADILTSFVNPLRDMGHSGCFFIHGYWLHSQEPGVKQCPQLENYRLAIAFLPFWFRFAQCMRRYHDTKVRAHLINGGKYMTSISVQVAAIFYTKNKSDLTLLIFIGANVASTIYSYYWDMIMDWGLFRSHEKGKKYLRSKLFYPVFFYYYAIVSNLILRCFWIIPLIPIDSTDWVAKSQLITLLVSVAEGFRRAQWSLIRIENENVNNFEKYRNILQIPPFQDTDDHSRSIKRFKK